jgi:hypothetical protein
MPKLPWALLIPSTLWPKCKGSYLIMPSLQHFKVCKTRINCHDSNVRFNGRWMGIQ